MSLAREECRALSGDALVAGARRVDGEGEGGCVSSGGARWAGSRVKRQGTSVCWGGSEEKCSGRRGRPPAHQETPRNIGASREQSISSVPREYSSTPIRCMRANHSETLRKLSTQSIGARRVEPHPRDHRTVLHLNPLRFVPCCTGCRAWGDARRRGVREWCIYQYRHMQGGQI